MFRPGVTVTSRSAASASSRPGATSAPIRSATDSVRARSMSHSCTRAPPRDERQRRRFAVHAGSDDRRRLRIRSPECLRSEHRRRAGAERGDRARVEHRLRHSVRRVGEQHEPGDGRQPLRGIARERRHPLQQCVAATESRHRAKVAFRIRGDVDLGRHRPLAARIGDERFAHRLERTLGRDSLAHLRSVEERNHLDQPPVSPLYVPAKSARGVRAMIFKSSQGERCSTYQTSSSIRSSQGNCARP